MNDGEGEPPPIEYKQNRMNQTLFPINTTTPKGMMVDN